MGLILPEITKGGLVKVTYNPNGWRGIELGEVYRVHDVSEGMFSISTADYPDGAYLMLDWGEPVWDCSSQKSR